MTHGEYIPKVDSNAAGTPWRCGVCGGWVWPGYGHCCTMLVPASSPPPVFWPAGGPHITHMDDLEEALRLLRKLVTEWRADQPEYSLDFCGVMNDAIAFVKRVDEK